jgi:hypothetical protein
MQCYDRLPKICGVVVPGNEQGEARSIASSEPRDVGKTVYLYGRLQGVLGERERLRSNAASRRVEATMPKVDGKPDQVGGRGFP